ncbi:MAG TPA: hypothetical protein VHP33_10715 [Polyangiaceae bacterium]|nr:hypothetical protein [Polyangiaceae bacterium]
MQASYFGALRLLRLRRSVAVPLALIAGCTSTPDEDRAVVDEPSVAGGVMNAAGGVQSSGGFGTAGTGLRAGGSGTAQPGGASATGGVVNVGGAATSGGTPGTGGTAGTGGTTSAGGAAGKAGASGSGGTGGAGRCSDPGEIKFVASFDESVNSSYRPGLTACIAKAGALWNQLLTVPFDVTLEVLVSYDSSISTANCRSTATVERDAAKNIYELSAAHEIRTGVDPNGSSVDIEINFGTALTNGTYWFDPDPSQRTATIPSGKIDVLSTCTHELGHAIAFSGVMNPSTGSLPGYSFLYDEHATRMGSYYYFTGVEAEAAYGSEVPLNTDILDHLGNVSPAPGSDLDLDLMHGTPTRYQRRYYPTDVNAGILADLGLPVVGTPAAEAVCSSPKALAKALGSPKLGPVPYFVE